MKTSDIVQAQRTFFASNQSKDLAWRVQKLEALKASIHLHEEDILAALQADLGKAAFEGYATELGLVKDELGYALKHVRRWARPRRVPTPLAHLLSTSKIYSEPYGVVLVMAPWNYPFLLSMAPLIGALAAGNCFLLKPSDYAPHTARLLKTIIEEVFDPQCGAVILGGREQNKQLLSEQFDYIFFTGSTGVGKVVMESAARHLTPLSLELGGKSPCIVDESANIALAAKRIVWGKFINAGQTCVAPDYLYVHQSIKPQLIAQMQGWITKFYGAEPLKNEELPKIINQKHFDRLLGLMAGERVLAGGQSDSKTLKIVPTLLDGITWDSPVMQEEIFGPILPVMSYQHLDQVIPRIKAGERPLALYLFTTRKEQEQRILRELSYGGGCINDCLIHLATPHLPFGGAGASGMGAYHGKHSFDTFSHQKSVMKKSNLFDVFIRYAPYKNKISLLKKVLR